MGVQLESIDRDIASLFGEITLSHSIERVGSYLE